jgi:hypothetical protein
MVLTTETSHRGVFEFVKKYFDWNGELKQQGRAQGVIEPGQGIRQLKLGHSDQPMGGCKPKVLF